MYDRMLVDLYNVKAIRYNLLWHLTSVQPSRKWNFEIYRVLWNYLSDTVIVRFTIRSMNSSREKHRADKYRKMSLAL